MSEKYYMEILKFEDDRLDERVEISKYSNTGKYGTLKAATRQIYEALEKANKQPEPLKTLKDQGCPECGCDVEYKSAYCESTQEFWLDGTCTNHACEHQTDIVPATWERKEG